MALADQNTDLIDAFDEFYRNYYRDEIGELAQGYPTDEKSLHVDWQDLYRFDPDLADDFRTQPEQLQEYAEEALRLYDLPVDVSLGQAHVRVRNLPEATPIREIRADHRGNLIAVQGIVRKATDVRPKVTNAAFECQRCGTLTRIPQAAGDFQEPHECQGCERQGPFRVNFDQSEFVDAQKIRVQESPEGLRGGETPQNIDLNIEDDICGEVTAGDHVKAVGVLQLDQKGNDREKSPMFDVYMDGMSVEIEDEQFEEMDITEEDKQRIIELSNDGEIYEKMVGSIAPSIYGYDEEKLAMALQLFSGVTKHLPDGSRIRGDLHMLLIGDPGTGKCVHGDTKVTLRDGTTVPIRELVESNLEDPIPIDDGVYDTVEFEVPSMAADGSMMRQQATKVWKREAPESLYRIRTTCGREIEVTPSHPLFVQSEGSPTARRAAELSTGEFVAVPSKLPTSSDDTLSVGYRLSRAPNAVRLQLPETWTPWLARLVGYIIAEGYVTLNEDNTGEVVVTNNDREILDDVADAFERLDLTYTERESRPKKVAKEISCTASEFVSFLEEIEPSILKKSNQQRVPDDIQRASPAIKRAFLRAYVDSEGTVSGKQRDLSVASMSRELLEGVQQLLVHFGVRSQLRSRENGSYRLSIGGTDFEQYRREVGFVTDRKATASAAYEETSTNTNTNLVPVDTDQLRHVRESLGLSQFDCGVPRTTYQHYERGDRVPSRSSLGDVVAAFEQRLEGLANLRGRVASGEWRAVEVARDELDIAQAELANSMRVSQGAVSYYERNEVVPDGGKIGAAPLIVLDRIDEALDVRAEIRKLRSLAAADVSWDRIESIERIAHDEDWVYDLEVAGTHSYVAEGIVSHNSQLLSYIQNIAPRSVYTSGKGSSSAGLTAAAVQDDFGEGQQWTLEAGALVLADKGIAAIDELDKMQPDDRSAMHEALEQQSISISKAGINATLKSRCSLLGAANPKYGRFDEFEPIGEQIDLEPALISRFDLIFTVTDQPDAEKDAELADHILTTNYAGEISTHRENNATSDFSQEDVESVTETVDPTIDPELLRKYVAHAKRSCFPTMTDEAKEAIRDFYVDMRAKGEDADSAVPVTARKLEALVRLAEASARVRLSDTVEMEDAERVIGTIRSSLEDVGVDPETGEFDADVVETGTSKTQRDRIQNIKGIIADIETEYDEGAPIDVVIDRAEEVGIDETKAQHEIDQLKTQGELYEPKTDHLRTT